METIRTTKEGKAVKTKHFLEDQAVYKAYDRWINGADLFTRGYYEQKLLFEFVRTCFSYVKYSKFIKRDDAWRKINFDVFMQYLDKDLSNRNLPNHEEKVNEVYIQFEYLIRYQKFLDGRF